MNLEELELREFSSRTLNLLALVFGGSEARVILSERAVHPLTVALESRTIVLDPFRTGLYDLALGARLLEHRSLRREGRRGRRRSDRWLTREAGRRLVPQAHEALARAYRGIGLLRGRFRRGKPCDDLRIVNQAIEWQPLPRLPPASPEQRRRAEKWRAGDSPLAAGVHCEVIPEVEIHGADGDFEWLLAAIENGNVVLGRLPGLDELPYLRIPLRICSADSNPTIEEMEQLLSEPRSKQLIQTLMNCHRRKSEVRTERLNIGRHEFSGMHLDSSRLVEAVIGPRVGLQPALFRRKGSLIEPVFDPREHLTVITFDANDLANLDWEGRRAHCLRFVACMLTVFQRLEVDTLVQAHADRIVTLRDGSCVCLHFQTLLKAADDAFDDGFWLRFGQLVRNPLSLPGTPTCFHSLGMRDIARAFDDIASEQEHSYRTTVWWARHGMSWEFEQFRTPPFLMRVADDIDHEMAELERRLTGTFDTLPCFLPEDLKQFGQPRGFLQSVYT